MTSRHLVDPDYLARLDLMPSLDLTAEALPAIRAQLVEGMVQNAPLPDDSVLLEHRDIAGPGGTALRLHIYRPRGVLGALPVLLHFHPGGYIMGVPEMRDTRNRQIALAVNCIIVSVRYRLAPEAPFPAALEDGYAALCWVHKEAGSLSADPQRIAVCGESAGGGLAASIAQMAHDKGDILLLMQVLTYPMLDNRTGSTIAAAKSCGEFVWTPQSNRFAWTSLLGEDHVDRELPPYAAPGRRADLAGLPPTFIAVGAIDLFAEEGIDYASRLLHAGVPTQLHVFPGAFHGFDSIPGAWGSDTYLDLYVSALSRGFARADATATA